MTPKKIRSLFGVIPVVLAFGLFGCGDGANTILEDPPVDTTPPGAPVNLAVNQTEAALSISWDENSEPDLSGYMLERSTDSGTSWSAVADTTLAEAAFTDDYFSRASYRVAAVDFSENQSAYTQANYAEPHDPQGPKWPANQY